MGVCMRALNAMTVRLKCNTGKKRAETNMFPIRFKRVIEKSNSNIQGKEIIMLMPHKNGQNLKLLNRSYSTRTDKR